MVAVRNSLFASNGGKEDTKLTRMVAHFGYGFKRFSDDGVISA